MNASNSQVLSSGGLQVGSNATVSADTNNPFEVTIPAAKAGTLTTRTDNDTGVVTSVAHGILDTDNIDLYDADGIIIRKDMDVTAVTADTISINAGSGSNLPVLTTAVKVAKQKIISPVFFDASGIQIFGIELSVPGATTKGRANFLSAVPASVGDMSLTANVGLISNVAAGAANPLSADAVSITASNGNSDLDGVLTIISMEDRTP
jgi:hypothetical protein